MLRIRTLTSIVSQAGSPLWDGSRRRWFHILVCGWLVAGIVAPDSAGAADVTWSNGLLTVSATNEPLSLVLSRIGEVTGIEIVGLEHVRGRVTIRPMPLTLAETVETLLTDYNFVLRGGTRYSLRIHSRVADAATDEGSPAPVRAGRIIIPLLEGLRVPDLAAAPAPDVPDTSAKEDDDGEDADNADKSDEDEDANADDDVSDAVTAILQDDHGGDGPLETLSGESVRTRLKVLDELRASDRARAVPALIRAMADDDDHVSQHAIDLLSDYTDAESLKQLGETLRRQSGDPLLRIGALRVLAERADPQSVQYLQAVVKDANPIVRQAASEMLAELVRRSTSPR